MHYSISALREADHKRLRHILSNTSLRESLYPQAVRPPDIEEAVTDWCTEPNHDGDLQFAARSAQGPLHGCVRLEQNELSYFVDPDYWGKGCGTFMVRWMTGKILVPREGAVFQAIVERQNRGSIRVVENAGFLFSGICDGYPSSRTLLKYTLRT